jgi:hypothetical protein
MPAMLRRALTATIVVGVALAPTAAAQAKEVLRDDARQDVVSYTETFDEGLVAPRFAAQGLRGSAAKIHRLASAAPLARAAADDDMWTPEPSVTNGDIVRTKIKNGTWGVRVRIRFADLAKRGELRADTLQFVTNEGYRRDVDIIAGPDEPRGWHGTVEMTRSASGRHVRCAVRHGVDYTKNVVTLSFPRTCLSKPRWIKVGIGSLRLDVNDANDALIIYADDARSATVADDLTMSRRVYRD